MIENSIWNGKEEKITLMINENNIRECSRIFERAEKCSANELSKKRPFCRKVVLYTMKGYNFNAPDELLKLHKEGIVYLGIGEIRECLKMIAQGKQTVLEVNK